MTNKIKELKHVVDFMHTLYSRSPGHRVFRMSDNLGIWFIREVWELLDNHVRTNDSMGKYMLRKLKKYYRMDEAGIAYAKDGSELFVRLKHVNQDVVAFIRFVRSLDNKDWCVPLLYLSKLDVDLSMHRYYVDGMRTHEEGSLSGGILFVNRRLSFSVAGVVKTTNVFTYGNAIEYSTLMEVMNHMQLYCANICSVLYQDCA